jgi:hypothetical protein
MERMRETMALWTRMMQQAEFWRGVAVLIVAGVAVMILAGGYHWLFLPVAVAGHVDAG